MKDRKAYYAANREKARAQSRAWYAKNRARALATAKKYRKKNAASVRARELKWRADNPDKHALAGFRSQLKTTYSLSLGEYEAMFRAQGGLCAICREPETVRRGGRGNKEAGDKPRRLGVDHDHRTRKVRGLLCHKCNCAVGYLNAENLRRAAAYLDHWIEDGPLTAQVRGAV